MIEAGQVRRRHPRERCRPVVLRRRSASTGIGTSRSETPLSAWPPYRSVDSRMEVVLITYESELPPDEVTARFRERSGKYREMEGLVQKLYLRDEATGRFGGIYVFDSEASRDALFETDVHATLREAYAVKGDVDVSTFHLEFPLYDSVNLAAAG